MILKDQEVAIDVFLLPKCSPKLFWVKTPPIQSLDRFDNFNNSPYKPHSDVLSFRPRNPQCHIIFGGFIKDMRWTNTFKKTLILNNYCAFKNSVV